MPYPGYKNKRETKDVQPEPIRREEGKAPADTVGKTETFVTRNIKLLTFIACMIVIVAAMAGFGIYRALHYGDLVPEPENLMTPEQMQTLVAKGGDLTWQDFHDYGFEVKGEDIVYIRRYDVQGGDYYLMVTSESEGTSIISVILVDLNTYEQTEIFAPEKVQ
jgi:hypothetical protein